MDGSDPDWSHVQADVRPDRRRHRRHRHRGRRPARAARKQLSRDLATYTRPSEIEELEAVLERYDEAETADIRRILVLNRNRAA